MVTVLISTGQKPSPIPLSPQRQALGLKSQITYPTKQPAQSNVRLWTLSYSLPWETIHRSHWACQLNTLQMKISLYVQLYNFLRLSASIEAVWLLFTASAVSERLLSAEGKWRGWEHHATLEITPWCSSWQIPAFLGFHRNLSFGIKLSRSLKAAYNRTNRMQTARVSVDSANVNRIVHSHNT